MISCLHRWPVHFYSEDRPFSSAIAAEVDCYIDCSGLYDRAGEGSRIVTGWLTTLPALVQWSFVNSENTEVHFKMPSILVKLPLFKIHTGDLSSKHLCEDSSEICFYFPWDFFPNQYDIQVFLSYCRFSFCLPTACLNSNQSKKYEKMEHSQGKWCVFITVLQPITHCACPSIPAAHCDTCVLTEYTEAAAWVIPDFLWHSSELSRGLD